MSPALGAVRPRPFVRQSPRREIRVPPSAYDDAVDGKLSQTRLPDGGSAVESRFLLLSDVAAELNVSDSQLYHMVRSGELPAIKIGGRGQWRVERVQLEAYIERKYAETAEWVAGNPLIERESE